jgi:hypothetical protein
MASSQNEFLKVQARAQAESIKSIDFKGEPSYVLLIHADDPHLCKGDNYNISIKISGAGDVDCAKLTLSSASYLVDGGIVFTYRLTIDEAPLIMNQPLPAFVELPAMIFTNFNHITNEVTGYTTLSNVGEWSHHPGGRNDPILSFSFKIAKDAPEGDHTFFINLTYKSLHSGIWYTDKQTINLHIDHWYEDSRLKYLIIAPIIPALVMTWIYFINPLYHFLNGLDAPILLEFAKLAFFSILLTAFFYWFFERYD